MGPKIRYTREQIIDAAFDIAREEGMDNVTTRKIAEKIGSSVAPIYVNFASSEEILSALVERIITVSRRLLAEEQSGDPFGDIGRASLRFAAEYSVLFRDLVMKNRRFMGNYNQQIEPYLIAEMQKDPKMQGLSRAELKTILLKMKIFQLGLSMMVANSLLPPDYGMDEAMELLADMARDVVSSARLKGGKEDGY